MFDIKFKKKIAVAQKIKFLAEHSFLTTIFFFLIATTLSFLVYYQYVFLAQKAEPNITEQPIKFQEEKFQNILNVWQEKEERLRGINSKTYKNPFLAP